MSFTAATVHDDVDGSRDREPGTVGRRTLTMQLAPTGRRDDGRPMPSGARELDLGAAAAIVQRKVVGGADVGAAELSAAAARGVETPAGPLPHRARLEASFGRDLGGIRAHTGGEAAATASSMGALAYATGDHVVLGADASLHTVAHEAAHVLQQRSGVARKSDAPGDELERHADAVADRVVAGRSAEDLIAGLSGLGGAPAAAPVQRRIYDGARALDLGAVQAAVARDPSARINNAGALAKLREMIADDERYTIAEIVEALGGGPRRVERGDEGDITLQPPLAVATMALADIAGTHRSVAASFDDGRTVEAMTEALVGDPTLVSRTENFVLTVFRSTAPGQPTGAALVWSMNNRRLKAMQQADERLRTGGRQLPAIRVKWATKEDMEHAIRPGAFNNAEHAQVGFHSTGSRVARLATLSSMSAPQASSSASQSQPSVAQVQASLGDSEALAKMFDL